VALIRLDRGELDGLDLYYTSAGRGPVTLLIHGLGGFAESWHETLAALEPHTRVVALDLPGCGQSAKPRRPYTLAFFAQVVEGFVRALGAERVSLVGHSLGGAVATAFALAYPGRVERMALLGAIVPGFPLQPSAVYRLMTLPGVGEFLSRLVTRGVCSAALARCFVVPRPDAVAFLVEHQYAARTAADGRAAYLSTLRGVRADFTVRAEAYRSALLEWSRPTLIIHGCQDPVVPIRHARAVVEGMPGAQARWLDGCGHFPQIEHAPTVNGWLGEFLLARAGL